MENENQLIIDLTGIKTEDQVLLKFGEVFEFGGTNGNHAIDVDSPEYAVGTNLGWGMNWDALNDSMKYLEQGGITKRSKLFYLPLKVIIQNSEALKQNEPESFNKLKEILDSVIEYYKKDGKIFEVNFF